MTKTTKDLIIKADQLKDGPVLYWFWLVTDQHIWPERLSIPIILLVFSTDTNMLQLLNEYLSQPDVSNNHRFDPLITLIKVTRRLFSYVFRKTRRNDVDHKRGERTILMHVADEQFKKKPHRRKHHLSPWNGCFISYAEFPQEMTLQKCFWELPHTNKRTSLDPQRCLPALHTLRLQTLRPHSREGVGSAQALKDTQQFADSSNLFNLWLGPGMSTMEWCYGSWQQYLTLL